jgi:hypothetical protein
MCCLGVSAAGFVCFPVSPVTVLLFADLVSQALSLSSLSLSRTDCVLQESGTNWSRKTRRRRTPDLGVRTRGEKGLAGG